MANYEIDPEDVLTDFLRVHLTDPKARAEASTSQAVTATAGQTSITLSPPSGTASCITALTINGTSKNKWRDYYWDYQTQKVTFFTALTLSDAVVITFKYGTSNWIYSDRPDSNLSAASFPRISLFTVSSPGKRLGQYTAPVESSHMFQIDLWAKIDYTATISGRTYSNEYLVRYYGNQILRALEEHESDMFNLLYNYTLISGPKDAPYSDRNQAFHGIVEINMKGLKSGRIEI